MTNKIMLPIFLLSFVLYSFTTQPTENREDAAVAYKKFLAKFKKTDLPYSISLDDMEKADRMKLRIKKLENPATEKENKKEEPVVDTYLDDEYMLFIPGIAQRHFTRMGSDVYRAEALLAQNKKFDALVYKVTHAGWGGTQVTYYLATFTKEGTAISTTRIATNNYGESTVKINKKLKIQIEENTRKEGTKTLRKYINKNGNIIDVV